MKTLHKFILKSYIGPFVMTFFIAMFVFFMMFIFIEEIYIMVHIFKVDINLLYEKVIETENQIMGPIIVLAPLLF